ncbi:MAG: T9SS type A sorting domain-containing protein, partial [Bacteroidia bacterium]
DTVPMGLGCKSLEILDSDGDGMSFWANNDGGGFFRLMKLGGGVLKTFEPDFGNGTKLNFTIMHTLDIPKKEIDLGFELYPNPTNGVFNVSGGDLLNADYEVYNSFGQVVLTPTTFNGQTLQIDLTNQASGMYFLKITKEGHTWTKKVILN